MTFAIQLADGTSCCKGHPEHHQHSARHENLTRSYTIQTMRPTRIPGEDTQTNEAEGLKKSLVVQRWDD
ncbi:uncharacterized protein FOMMEDRAFT_159280 [Fomitiporia mediterranea MF3/22]|uniref:uncharacterized protein n=1 Tax=Fomitiporia mediterranea (strain MF3/22) TaxID=694068 RepID=UPI00044076A3|nr:uncharacterized protein FOMMEDRAFT_159280 [Fomitiporia mediterranea MF3/22]EJD00544.1 hypothetical protein FOMMEDRAFT_159280 [Fomitiporia mediterranea MF3/22]